MDRLGIASSAAVGPLVAGFTAAGFGFRAAFAVAGIPAIIALVVVALGRETLAEGRA